MSTNFPYFRKMKWNSYNSQIKHIILKWSGNYSDYKNIPSEKSTVQSILAYLLSLMYEVDIYIFPVEYVTELCIWRNCLKFNQSR